MCRRVRPGKIHPVQARKQHVGVPEAAVRQTHGMGAMACAALSGVTGTKVYVAQA